MKSRQHQYINNPIMKFVDKLIELIKKALYGIAGVLLALAVVAVFFLPGTGEYKAGDEIEILRHIHGAKSIETLEKNYGSISELRSDGVNTIDIPRYKRIKIIKTMDNRDLALIEVLSGSYEGTQWWVKKSSIKRKRADHRY
ncbi:MULTISPECIES: hypothetical protein [Bacillus]|nr:MULTISPECIES: hypothetical protein [Bacillus]MDN5387718.1 hypothetical protein [Bacillus sp. LB7]MEC1021733.1 hypothetical protein [Bacillus paralicheniformis]MEC1028664.1 hypothetical protein [Bacillus paralicheniformis]MEC1032963.1 hypothetical protein [Bacillus paralicheniformis]MEC1052013.1 hypothetical protein [Bacillus paralicheniformis]